MTLVDYSRQGEKPEAKILCQTFFSDDIYLDLSF
jgi:hypothetical protein